MLSNHKKSYYRDSKIVNAVQEMGVLNTEQIEALFFTNQKQSKRIAQRRLLRLNKLHKLRRGRESLDQPYYYYITKYKQVAHILGVNWVRIWLSKWESIHSFSYEQDYGVLRCDGFAAINKGNKLTFYFVEFDNADSWNAFDKVEKYNRLYEQQPVAWWVKLTKRFPAIIVVTTGRKKHINKKIKEDNTHGLEFKVYNLEDIKGAF